MSVRYQGLEGSEDVALIFLFVDGAHLQALVLFFYFLLYGSRRSLAWPLPVRNHTPRAVPLLELAGLTRADARGAEFEGNNIIQRRTLP